jgi:hypothetical protein
MSSLMLFIADASGKIKDGANAACADGACNKTGLNDIFAGVANTLIFVVGAISVIMIIIGGLRYVLSNGDSKQTESAKNTILYAVAGVVVAIASYAIVNFVVKNIK